MQHAYLVRLGQMGHMGRFAAASDGYARGEAVVVRTARGLELGEILVPATGSEESGGPTVFEILRKAGPDDLERARESSAMRNASLAACDRVICEGHWPVQLLDAEPLLDGRTVVLHYLGPHAIDAEDLLGALRHACGLDIWLEPVGIDAASSVAVEETYGHCGSGGCGAGCGAEGAGCGVAGDAHERGCSGCTVKDLLKSRR